MDIVSSTIFPKHVLAKYELSTELNSGIHKSFLIDRLCGTYKYCAKVCTINRNECWKVVFIFLKFLTIDTWWSASLDLPLNISQIRVKETNPFPPKLSNLWTCESCSMNFWLITPSTRDEVVLKFEWSIFWIYF